jgi:regulator of sigma D
MSASVAPDARIQCSINIISELVNYLVQSYEDRYDETKAIIEQDMAVSKEAVQERFPVEDVVIK